MKRFLSLTMLMLWTLNLFACGSPVFSDKAIETDIIHEDGIGSDWYLDSETKFISIKCNEDGYPTTLGIALSRSVTVDGANQYEYNFISHRRYTEDSSILEFTFEGRQSLIVIPDVPLEGNPTVWRTEFFEAFDMADKALLEKGWHIVYHSVSDMYGAPKALSMMHEFQNFITIAFGISRTPTLFGFSRGGLYAVNYAAEYPDCVGGIYLDAPVQDIRDWPCRDDLKGTPERRACMYLYGLTDATLPYFDGNPYEKAEEIAHIPTIIVAGLADTTVTWEKNGAITAERLKMAGANVEVILKEDCAHHPHSLEDPTPIVEFIEKYCK